MLERLHSNRKMQLALGLVLGVCFGFLLQRGGVTRYEVIMGQLLLTDFTVLKIIFTAIVVGMAGVFALRREGLAELHAKAGSVGSTVIGGLIFGLGFGLLGYCPGTLAGAAGQGSLDALFGGALGMLVGAWLYALMYETLSRSVLKLGDFGQLTLPELFGLGLWKTITLVALVLAACLAGLEAAGF